MAGSSGKYDSDDNAFLDFGPEPIDKDVYNEVVNKELEAAREQSGKHAGRTARHESARQGRTKKKSKLGAFIKAVVITGILFGVIYGAASTYFRNYYGDNDVVNAIKYGGFNVVEDYADFEAFDSIDIELENCDLSVAASYDDKFHISYKFLVLDGGVSLDVEDRDGSRVLTCSVDNKTTTGNIWTLFDESDDYTYRQYLTVMVPEGQYKSFTLGTTGGDVDVSDVVGRIDELNITASDSDSYAVLREITVGKLSVTTHNQYLSVRDCEFDSAEINVKNADASVYDCKVTSLLDIDAENTYLIVSGVDIEDGGKISARTSGDDLSVLLPGDPESYHIVAVASHDTVYCSHYDYYEDGRYEVGDGDRDIELYNEDEGIFLHFEVDE